jgi:hypothetical protein
MVGSNIAHDEEEDEKYRRAMHGHTTESNKDTEGMEGSKALKQSINPNKNPNQKKDLT